MRGVIEPLLQLAGFAVNGHRIVLFYNTNAAASNRMRIRSTLEWSVKSSIALLSPATSRGRWSVGRVMPCTLYINLKTADLEL